MLMLEMSRDSPLVRLLYGPRVGGPRPGVVAGYKLELTFLPLIAPPPKLSW